MQDHDFEGGQAAPPCAEQPYYYYTNEELETTANGGRPRPPVNAAPCFSLADNVAGKGAVELDSEAVIAI